jgi:hypothetical protein
VLAMTSRPLVVAVHILKAFERTGANDGPRFAFRGQITIWSAFCGAAG